MLKRKIEQSLTEWKHTANHKPTKTILRHPEKYHVSSATKADEKVYSDNIICRKPYIAG